MREVSLQLIAKAPLEISQKPLIKKEFHGKGIGRMLFENYLNKI